MLELSGDILWAFGGPPLFVGFTYAIRVVLIIYLRIK
jgi:hypothetical protein